MAQNFTLTVDPGLSGGLAWKTPKEIGCKSMPETEGDLVAFLKGFKLSCVDSIPEAVVEEVGGFIGKFQTGSSMFVFGRNFGVILGSLQALGFRVRLVRPQKWQGALGLGNSRGMAPGAWKNKLKARAQQLFPEQKVTLKTADALLLLEYSRIAP